MFSSEFCKVSQIIFFPEISKLPCVTKILDKTVEAKKKIYFQQEILSTPQIVVVRKVLGS